MEETKEQTIQRLVKMGVITNTGNCFSEDALYNCTECGFGNLCDVCHDHDEPRGECFQCKICTAGDCKLAV